MTKSLSEMQAEVTAVNKANGWFDTDRSFGDDIALLHSEVSEAFEAYRSHGFADLTAPNDNGPQRDGDEGTSFPPPKPEGVASELSDVLIRLLDTCDRYGFDLEQEYDRKIAFNRTRKYRHGNKTV